MSIITFDIETIPTQKKLNAAQEKFLERRITLEKEKQGHDLSENDVNTIMATHPYLGQIVCIGIFEESDQSTTSLVGPEESILKKFWSIIGKPQYQRGTFVHYNGMGFDVPFIVKRSMIHKIPVTNQQFLNMVKFRINPHYDVALMDTNWGSWGPMVKLDLITQMNDIPSPKDKISGEHVFDYWKEGKIGDIAEYCLKDVMATYQVLQIQKNYIFDK
jgi:3'-5' exonuclease